MPHSYTHLLIPTDPAFVPHPGAVGVFLRLIEALGVVPEPWELWVLDRAGSSILTTPTRKIKIPGRKVPLEDVSEIEGTLADIEDYDMRASGEGVPRRLLMSLHGIPDNLSGLAETLHVAVACHGRPSTVAMSDVHDEATPVLGGFVPCEPADRPGFFTHPETLKRVEVPHTGAARFWVSVHVGNALQPVFGDDGFRLIGAALLQEFEQILGTPLGQGGTWG